MNSNKFGCMAASFILLTACGGGGSGNDVPPPSFADTTSSATSSVRMITIKNETAIADVTGTLDRSSNTLTLDGEAANISNDRTNAAFVNTGLGQLDFDLTGTTEYAVLVEGTQSETGVIGVPTATTDLPGGLTTYSGNAQLIVNDSSDSSFFDLAGIATVDVDFGGGNVDVSLTDMNGELTRGAAAPVAVTDAIDVTITGGTLSGSAFNGGTAAISSPSGDLTSSLSSNEVLTHAGGIFGPNGDEVGGVFVLDDSGTGSITGAGVYLAD